MPAPGTSTSPTSPSQAKEIVAALAEKSISISALGYYPNPLHPDPAHRADRHRPPEEGDRRRRADGRRARQHLLRRRRRARHVDANWEEAQKVWPDIIAHARDNGVKLAFENCPMIFSYDEWPGGHNIAYSPYIWRRILEAWGGDVGMNYDPSHLVWQMIDQARFIREFGPHMLHVHAKDVMIDRDGLYERGIMSAGMGWQIPRMPGLGDVDWSVFFSGLYRVGYDGPVDHRARGPEVRGQRRTGEARLPARPRRASPLCEDNRPGAAGRRTTDQRSMEEDNSMRNVTRKTILALLAGTRAGRRGPAPMPRRTPTRSACRTPCRATAGARK